MCILQYINIYKGYFINLYIKNGDKLVNEHKLKDIGSSKFFLVPHEFIKVYDLNKYIYHCEVSKDGKTITYRRMREDKGDEEINEENKQRMHVRASQSAIERL